MPITFRLSHPDPAEPGGVVVWKAIIHYPHHYRAEREATCTQAILEVRLVQGGIIRPYEKASAAVLSFASGVPGAALQRIGSDHRLAKRRSDRRGRRRSETRRLDRDRGIENPGHSPRSSVQAAFRSKRDRPGRQDGHPGNHESAWPHRPDERFDTGERE